MGYNKCKMPDLKKLITGFLIIAAAASSSALVLSNLGGSAVVSSNTAATDTLSFADQNAFVPTQDDVINAVVNSDATVAAALNDPNNLTTNFTNAFLNGVADANPTGLNPDANGNENIASPDPATVSKYLSQAPALKNLKLPNWDSDVAAQKIKVATSVSAGQYSDALNGVFDKDLVQSGIQDLVGQKGLDPSNFAAIESPLQGAVSDAASTPTPAKLVTFQKSLVAMLVYERNMAALADEAKTDPVKASLVFQNEENAYDKVLSNFATQSQKVSSQGLFSFNNVKLPSPGANPGLAFLQTYFGLPMAHAQWLTFDATTFGEWIKQEIETLILQIVKNTLVAFIQQRVLTWIKGSGAPLFVQQFANQLVNIAQAKAISSLAGVLPGYKASCPNIGNLLGQTTLNLGLTAPIKNIPTCNIPAVSASQLTNFYNNFSFGGANAVPGGGWGLYAQVLNPNNNYYGALAQTTDYVGQQVGQAQQAAQTKTVANNGFKGSDICANGDDPNGYGYWCVNVNDSSDIYTLNQDGSCDTGYAKQTMSNGGQCPDGSDPKSVTPGQTVKTAHDTALGGSLQLTVNANSIEGVLASVATSLINTLAQAAISTASQLGTQYATQGLLSVTAGSNGSSNGSSISGGVTAPVVPSSALPQLPPTACAPQTPCDPSLSSSTCISGYPNDIIHFSATGGDGYDYAWTVDAPIGVMPSVASGTGPQFSVSFAIDPNGTSTLVFPITIPVDVMGSDNATDSCSAVITSIPISDVSAAGASTSTATSTGTH
jgi:hypothetical protein